jgi:ATP-dependent exoDNAse (exonuclease V) alpha subunit
MSDYQKFTKAPEFASLTNDQKLFARKFFEGGFLHLTGEAGTGKSFIIKTLFDFMSRHGKPFAKTATTGVASFNIGGSTLHSFFGLGFGDEHVEYLINKIKKNKKASSRIRGVNILLIDEVSMLAGSLLNKIDLIMKYFRHDNRPFGGVRAIIACGDFLQLPAIFKDNDIKELAFQSRAWTEAEFKNITLKEVVRQKDKNFSNLLSKIRVGDTSDVSLLKTRFGAKFPDDGIKPIYLFCTNKDVNSFNENELRKNPNPEKTFVAKINGPDYIKEALRKNCPSPEFLTLKIGAVVMLTANIDQERGMVNGTMGVVKRFTNEGPLIETQIGCILVENNRWEVKEQVIEGGTEIKYKVMGSMEQLPLRIAYAATIHRVQGLTIDRAVLDMERSFSAGQLYVALSRVRDLESVSLVNFPSERIYANEECLEFYRKN